MLRRVSYSGQDHLNLPYYCGTVPGSCKEREVYQVRSGPPIDPGHCRIRNYLVGISCKERIPLTEAWQEKKGTECETDYLANRASQVHNTDQTLESIYYLWLD